MKRSLLDINVLLALLDEIHQHHEVAMSWLMKNIAGGWASCPLTQNGFIRIISQTKYVRPISIARAIKLLEDATATKHHKFWTDDVSILDHRLVDRTRVHGSKQLTDIYLLALAVRHQGVLVTFDGSIPISAVHGATRQHVLVL